MNTRIKLMAILVAFAVLTCGCLDTRDFQNHPKDDDGKPYWPPTLLDWAEWVASIITWEDIQDIAAWAATEGTAEAWEILEWYIKMLILADANTED